MSNDPDVIAGIHHESVDGVLRIVLVGRASVNMLISHVMDNFEEWTSHERLLYDFRRWDVGALSVDALMGVADEFDPVHEARPKARAALLIPTELAELARVLVALYESRGKEISLRTFFDECEARAWLQAG